MAQPDDRLPGRLLGKIGGATVLLHPGPCQEDEALLYMYRTYLLLLSCCSYCRSVASYGTVATSSYLVASYHKYRTVRRIG